MALVSDIEIRLRADIARLQQDLDRARQQVGSAMSRITDLAKGAAGALAGLGAGFAVGAIAGFVKSAIDATDAISDISQRTGVAIQDIAGLQLWFQKGGTEAGAFESAMIKLSKNIAAGGEEFRALGIATRNADGSLRTNVEVLLDSADAFSKMEDGTVKTALAIRLFDKSGAALIPLLNEGSEGLREMNEMADRLGLTFNEKTVNAAGDFNDTLDFLGLAMQGIGRQVAAELLPSLNSLAGTMLKTATEGNNLRTVSQTIVAGFKILYTAGSTLVGLFRVVGDTIAGVLAYITVGITSTFKALKLGIQGEYSEALATLQTGGVQAAAIAKATWTDVGATIKNTATGIVDVWTNANGEAVAAMAEITKNQKGVSEEDKKLAEKRASAYLELLAAADQAVAASAREAAGLAPLNEGQKLTAELDDKIREGKVKLRVEEEAALRSRYALVEANRASIESQKALEQMQKESGKLEKEMADARKDAIKTASDELQANQKLVTTFGMTESAIARLEVARLKEQLAQRSSVGMTLDEIEHLEKLIVLKEHSAQAVANREALEDTKKFWTEIEKTAHDTFVSIADGGKNAFKRLKDTAKNMFFDWLYQMTVKKWIINIVPSLGGGGELAALGQMLGLGGSGGGSAAASGGSSIGSLASLASTVKTGYTAISTGFASLGTSIGQGLSYVGNAIGSNSLYSFGQGMQGFSAGGVGSGISPTAAGYGQMASTVAGYAAGAAVGVYGGRAISNGYAISGSGNGAVNAGTAIGAIVAGPIGAAIGGLIAGTANRLFGHRAKEYTGEGTLNGTLGNSFSGTMDSVWRKKGGVFRSDKWGTDKLPVDAAFAQNLVSVYDTIKSASSDYAAVLGINADKIANRAQALSIKLGKDEEENQKAIAEFFAGVADNVARELLPNIGKFQAQGETASATLQRLAVDFQVVDSVLITLGVTSQQAFKSVGVASIEARERLIALAGGIDSLAAQTQFFADNFLTKAEQIAPLQQQVNAGLASLGYAGITSADQFKLAVMDLVRSGAIATEQGAKTYAGLMQLAPGFKTVADYLEELKQSTRDFASATVERLASTVEMQKDVVTAAYEEAMTRLGLQIDTVNDSIERTSSLSQALKNGLVSINSPASNFGSRQAAQAQITAALAIAKASGVLPSEETLRDALAAVGRDSSDQYGSLLAYQREVARTNNQLIELGGITDDQLSVQERQLQALKDQRDAATAANERELLRLDGLVNTAQSQLNAVLGVDNRVLSVEQAVKEATAAINSLKVAAPTSPSGPIGYVPPGPGPIKTAIPVVNSYPQSGTMVSSGAMLAELQNMNTRLANIESGTSRTASNTGKFATQFDTATGGGGPLLVQTA